MNELTNSVLLPAQQWWKTGKNGKI